MSRVRETLDRLEQELSAEIAEIRHRLAPLEQELAEVRHAKASLGTAGSPPDSRYRFIGGKSFGIWSTTPVGAPSPYAKLTMKELTRKALEENFPNGATAQELLELYHKSWGRTDISRSSLSPQLSRLKAEGVVDLDGYRWFLVPEKDEAPTGEPADASETVEGDVIGSQPPSATSDP